MKTSIWFSWVIFAVAIAALCVAIVRCEPIKADWVSIDIGVLAALATCLVGWQVYTLIDMRTLRRDFNRLKLDIENEKQTQRNALREFAAETRLLEAGRIIGSFDEKKGNHAVIGIGYCSLIQALKLLIGARKEFIDEVLGLMKKCIYLAELHNAWDKMFPDEIEQLSKAEYHFITSGLLGISDYVSQIDKIKEWRQNKTMDDAAFKEIQKEFTKSNPTKQ